MRLGRLASTALLTLAFMPGVAGAQPRPLPTPGPTPAPMLADTPAQRAQGVEVGAGSVVVAIFPAFGGHVSVPAGRRVRLETGAQIDLHGVFTGVSLPFVVPFATFSMAWHRERRWS